MPSTRCLLIAVCFLVASPASARTWTELDGKIAGPAGSAVLAFVQAHAESFGAPKGVTLKVRRVVPLRGGAMVRLERTLGRGPVFNGGLSLLVLGGSGRAEQTIVAASGRLDGTLAKVDGSLDPAAVSKRVAQLVPQGKVLDALPGYWRRGDTLRPAWSVQVRRARPRGAWRVILDAATAEVLSAASTLVPIFGKAYAPNPAVGSVKKVEILGLTDPGALSGEMADVQSCSASSSGTLTCQRYATADPASGDYLYDPDEPSFTDPFSEVHTYYHVDAFHRWMKDSFGFARQGAQQIKVMVNFNFESSSGNTQGLYNAFFGDIDDDGKGDLVFGQGKRDFAYDADVIYHEFTHSVVDETSDLSAAIDDLGFNVMPLSLNEAFADLFSSAFTGDPKVGEYAGGKNPIRTLTGPASCPDSLTGESHSDGLIWGRACWSVREKAQDKPTFDDVLYKTMVALDPEASFLDAQAMFLKVAGLADPALASLAASEFSSRSISKCTRIIPLGEGDQRHGYLMGRDSIPLVVVPGPMQYEIVVPAEATQLQVNLSQMSWSSATVGAYLRKGSPVKFSGSKSTFDFVLSNGEYSILLTRDDPKNRLEPGNTYYVLPLNVGNDATMYQISMALTLEEPPPPPSDTMPPQMDAGVVPALDSAGVNPVDPNAPMTRGCSCEIGQGSPGVAALPSLLGIMLGLVLLYRRRR